MRLIFLLFFGVLHAGEISMTEFNSLVLDIDAIIKCKSGTIDTKRISIPYGIGELEGHSLVDSKTLYISAAVHQKYSGLLNSDKVESTDQYEIDTVFSDKNSMLALVPSKPSIESNEELYVVLECVVIDLEPTYIVKDIFNSSHGEFISALISYMNNYDSELLQNLREIHLKNMK